MSSNPLMVAPGNPPVAPKLSPTPTVVVPSTQPNRKASDNVAVYTLMAINDERVREGKHILVCEAADEHGNSVCYYSVLITHLDKHPFLCSLHWNASRATVGREVDY